MKITSILRTIGLWVLILCVSISSIIDLFIGNTIWAGLKTLFTLGVICYEIYYYLKYKKTISTKYKNVIMKHETWGRISLLFFGLSLAGLIIHLWFW